MTEPDARLISTKRLDEGGSAHAGASHLLLVSAMTPQVMRAHATDHNVATEHRDAVRKVEAQGAA
jgi:hypothetical protein